MKRPFSGIVGFAILACSSASALAHDQGRWIGTWETSPVGSPTITKIGSYYTLPSPITIKGTIRYRLRISQGGSQIRLRFSNEYGEVPLALEVVSIGVAGEGLNALPGSLKQATFAGRSAITIPAGAPALTDPINISVKSLSDLIVSVYVPNGISTLACQTDATPTDPAAVDGSDTTLLEQLPTSTCISGKPVVSAIDVNTDHSRKVVVTLGDSITDGYVDPATGERGWPGALSRRLERKGVSVVNAGIGGNRLLQTIRMFGTSALSRLDRGVFSVPGLSHIVVLEGINDIGMSGRGAMFGDSPLVRPEELIAAYSQIIARAHERGVKVFGATILPFAVATEEGAYSGEKDKVRETVNAWIRTSKAFDGYIDFDEAMRDPAHPGSLKAAYDSGDHLHPNSAGYRAMGEVIDLKLFR
jgi:lysophospholipase L1-like esterase